ncbi:MAG TPA: amidohydrolase family protein [Chthonomonadaceae bacterium]|nr:amidohydrolase family protein [Chthonomonadaceae bacterium]
MTENEPLPIIDTHQHLWDFAGFRPPWLEGSPKLNKSHTMEDYLRAVHGMNVVKTVYMEVDLTVEDQLREAEYVEEICREGKTPMRAAVVSCRPGKPGFDGYSRAVHAMPHVCGFRQVLHGADTPPGYCLHPEFVRDIQHMGRLGMCFDLCVRPGELTDAAKLADACPDVRFVLDHCGNGSARNPEQARWARDISAIAQRPNVVCKISGIVRTVQPGWDRVAELRPIVLHCIEAFGIDRCMFAGDWPVCTLGAPLADWIACLKAIAAGSSAADQRKLFHDNAAIFYRIA